jgi:hypothetical protein
MTLEAQTIARACGHNHLHHLEPEDLCALTMEAAAMAQVPLAGRTGIRASREQDTEDTTAITRTLFDPGTHGGYSRMTTDLATFAAERGVKYFMISFTDLFGGQRAKLVPAQAIADMQEEGAGFAGFATWLDMTPAHPDMLAVPDPASVIQLPWKPEVAWVAANP